MSTQQGLTPLAEGRFSKTPFAHILVYLYERRHTGTLEARDGVQSATVYFREGLPTKVRTAVRGHGLGRVMRELGMISDDQLRACQEAMQQEGGLQGEILIRQGAIDATGLVRGLREQMLLKLADVFAMSEGAYAFYENVNLLLGYGGDDLFPLDPYPLILAGLREHGLKLKIESVLGEIKDKWLYLDAPAPLKRFRLRRSERAICSDLLESPRSYEELTASGFHNRQVARYMLYALAITKELQYTDRVPQVEAAAEKVDVPPAEVQFESVVPPPAVVAGGEDQQIAALRQRVMRKATEVASQNYFEMLELSVGAPVSEVQERFSKLIGLYHPDRVSGVEVPGISETVRFIYINLTEAHAILTDPAARAAYIDTIVEGDKRVARSVAEGRVEETPDVVQAEKLFQKGLVALRREQYVRAAEFVQRARVLNSSQAEYLAAAAYLEWKQGPGEVDLDNVVERLEMAAEENPGSERIQMFLGRVLQGAGKLTEALARFERVVELNPANDRAAREVRLLNLRLNREQEKPKGFIKRILG